MNTPTPDQPEKPKKYPPPAPMPPQQPPTYTQQPNPFMPQQQPTYRPTEQQSTFVHPQQQPAFVHPQQQQRMPPPGGPMPQTYLVLNIIAILFSCLFGAIGLYFSTQVTQRWNAGDVDGARKSSTTALVMGLIGIVVGAIVLLATLAGGGY